MTKCGTDKSIINTHAHQHTHLLCKDENVFFFVEVRENKSEEVGLEGIKRQMMEVQFKCGNVHRTWCVESLHDDIYRTQTSDLLSSILSFFFLVIFITTVVHLIHCRLSGPEHWTFQELQSVNVPPSKYQQNKISVTCCKKIMCRNVHIIYFFFYQSTKSSFLTVIYKIVMYLRAGHGWSRVHCTFSG